MTTANSQPTEPIEPVMASDLLAHRQARNDTHGVAGRDTLLTTECAEIDDVVMGGGWQRGQIVGLSGELAAGRMISLWLIASALMDSMDRVTVVDTGGLFPVRVLAAVLRRRIEARNADGVRKQGDCDKEAEAEMKMCLERVDICRALDFIGVVEIVGDVGRMCEDAETRQGKAVEMDGVAEVVEDMRQEIVDSEEEEESLEDSGASPQVAGHQDHNTKKDDVGTSVIIIDSITGVVGNLFNGSELKSSHSILQAFTTNLLSITRRHNILTLILNSTLNTPPPNQQARQTSAYATHGSQSISPSIFASNGHLRPSLGALFANIPELHLLLSRLPTRPQDAKPMYGGGELKETSSRSLVSVQYSYVLEVIKDDQGTLAVEQDGTKWESRERRWGAFNVENDIELNDAIVRGGKTQATGKAVHEIMEKGMGEGSSAVAKEYGFARNL